MSLFLFALLALDMSGAARELAHGAVGAIGHEPVVVSFRNMSSLGSAEAAEVRRVFESELQARGVRLLDTAPAAELRLTISEDPIDYLLVAEIGRGRERKVLVESWPREALPRPSGAARVSLERKLLWEDAQPILDAAVSGGLTVVLEGDRIVTVRGTEQQSAAIPRTHPFPRDIRGRLSVSGSAFNAWLPGMACHGSLQPQLTVECGDSQEPWLLAPGAIATFAPERNFFTGRVMVGSWGAHDLVPFYSAASAGDAWVFATADGQARIYRPSWSEAGNIDDWGSDLAGIQTPCGERILATRPGNGSEADAIRAYALAERAVSPPGPALEFAGPITALWAAGGSAVAVSRDLQTERYAAFSLVPACGS